MTVPSVTSVYQYSGNGSTKAFAFPAYLMASADIEVSSQNVSTGLEVTYTPGTDYSFAGTADDAGNYPNGGTITMVVAPATGIRLTLRRMTPLTQTADYAEGDKFPAASHEKALDRLALEIQDTNDRALRSIKFPKSDLYSTTAAILPSAPIRASKIIGFDASGAMVMIDQLSSQAIGLDNLTDVSLSSIVNGDILQYSSALGYWHNAALSLSGFQPLDSTLTALAGLATAVDQMIYTTGTDAFAMTALTAFARTILDDANQATMQTTLGVVPGTNVQAFDATLTALAGLTTAADQIIYSTGVDTFSMTSLGAWIRTNLLGVNSQAAALTALGVTSPGHELPVGGATGYILTKNSAADYDVGWAAGGAGGSQPADATLTALAALVTAADQMIYSTGVDAFSMTNLGAWARSNFLTATSQAAARTALALTPGTDVQAYDTELAAIAGLVSAADRLPYFTGGGTAALATFTSFARTLVDDVDAATMQATLGLVIGTNVQAFDANTAKINVAQSWSKPQRYPWTALTDAATVAWDQDTATYASVTIGANRTMGAPTNIRDGQVVLLKVGRSGAFTITSWNAAFDFGTAGVPTQSNTSGKFDVFSFVGVGTTKLDFIGMQAGFAQ